MAFLSVNRIRCQFSRFSKSAKPMNGPWKLKVRIPKSAIVIGVRSIEVHRGLNTRPNNLKFRGQRVAGPVNGTNVT
jgi:hypothetical protein